MPSVVVRFPNCADDIDAFVHCFVTASYTASVFHLMRVVEIGVIEVAKLIEVEDSKPSWGAILSKADKYAFRTEYKDLPDSIRPHKELLASLSNEMHGIQRAWRNKVAHIETKLVPVGHIDEEIAGEIMTAVEVFMRSLSERLPTSV